MWVCVCIYLDVCVFICLYGCRISFLLFLCLSGIVLVCVGCDFVDLCMFECLCLWYYIYILFWLIVCAHMWLWVFVCLMFMCFFRSFRVFSITRFLMNCLPLYLHVCLWLILFVIVHVSGVCYTNVSILFVFACMSLCASWSSRIFLFPGSFSFHLVSPSLCCSSDLCLACVSRCRVPHCFWLGFVACREGWLRRGGWRWALPFSLFTPSSPLLSFLH